MPVDPFELASRVAEVELLDFPGAWDGLMLRRRGKLPLIVIAKHLPKVRARFTAAHELAHVVLPWQFGSLFCHSEITYAFDDDVLARIEADANFFAAELLVPIQWVRANAWRPETGNLAEWLKATAASAKVSVIVAMLSAVRACAPGTLFVLTDEGKVKYVGCSPGSACPVPYRGERFEPRAYATPEVAYSSAPYSLGGTKVIHALAFPSKIEAAATEENCTSILDGLLDDLAIVGQERVHIRSVVNGVIGYAYDDLRAADGPPQALAVLVQRFTGDERDELRSVIEHGDFRRYLVCRAQEAFAQAKRSRRKRPKKITG